MDNLSHTVASLAAGTILHRCLSPESDESSQATRRRLLLTASALAGNFPDLDLVLTSLLPEPLGYLLHHRGHTHTLLYALPQVGLLALLLWLLWPGARRLLQGSRTARVGLASALGIGMGLHFLMDYLNSYGIHPFHPFDSRWFYGDMVFILEPVFWVAFGVPLLWGLRRPFAIGGTLLLGGLLLFFTYKTFLSPWSLLALAILGAALAVLRRMPRKTGTNRPILPLAISFAVALGFVVLQSAGSRQAAQMIATGLSQDAPHRRLHDIALTPFPSNPACWMFVSIESDQERERYFLQRGILAIPPGNLEHGVCPKGFFEEQSAAMTKPSVRWLALSTHEGNLTELKSLAASHCHVQAWLRFARMPWIDAGVASDLRYASANRSNFTTLAIGRFDRQPCPTGVPAWSMPREDLVR